MSNDAVKLIECPRDAWQGLKRVIPTDVKARYLRALIGAGFKHIDAVSFVCPKTVPQMADSEKVLEQLDPPDDVEIIGIVVNKKGVERAIATEAVTTLGVAALIRRSAASVAVLSHRIHWLGTFRQRPSSRRCRNAAWPRRYANR